MSRPHVLPHSAIPEFVERAELSDSERSQVYSACADALGKAAHVVLVLWAAPNWQLLAVQPAQDVAHLSTLELLALVDGWPGLIAQMLSKSQRGVHYTWIELQHLSAHSNAAH